MDERLTELVNTRWSKHEKRILKRMAKSKDQKLAQLLRSTMLPIMRAWRVENEGTES